MEFISLVKVTPVHSLPSTLQSLDLCDCSYYSLKQASKRYQLAKKNFIGQFPSWITDDNFYNVCKLDIVK